MRVLIKKLPKPIGKIKTKDLDKKLYIKYRKKGLSVSESIKRASFGSPKIRKKDIK